LYARRNTARWNKERFDEAMELTRTTIIPAYQEHPGFKGYVLLSEPDGDKGIAITMWDSKENMDSSIEIAQRMTAELRGILAEPPLTENFELLFKVDG
jgi:heme-degrading monooxygenase HmoA